MANPEHLKLLQQGVDVWNEWRMKNTDFSPDLRETDFRGADLSDTYLFGADLRRANLSAANLAGANFRKTILLDADLSGADLRRAHFFNANLLRANLHRANLAAADLTRSQLSDADLRGANLVNADLSAADLTQANLDGANLSGADLIGAVLVETNLANAILTRCGIFGISAWNVKINEGTKQQDLVITRDDEPQVTVDNLEVAQFVYLLLHNEKIRAVIDTVGKKGVLLLGRFTEGRIAVLERLREALRQRGYVPIVLNFDKPETKDFTETVRLLAGLSKFVIADITNPKSAPLELQATVPEIMVPFRPIIEKDAKPFAMLQDLWIKHREWVFPPLQYSSADALIGALDQKIMKPAEKRFAKLLARKAQRMKAEQV